METLRNPYEHKYKYGKQEQLIGFNLIKKLVQQARLPLTKEAYFWLLYYCSVRKSEAYERVESDFEINQTRLVCDFHQRKKHGATVPPLELPLEWYGVDKIAKCVLLARKRRPRPKTVFIYEPTEETRVTPKGRKVAITKRKGVRVAAKWVFPNIQSTSAWQIVKDVLGDKYYPHFLRLQGLSEIGSEPDASFVRLKSVSGIKSLRSLAAYLGTSKKEQDKALELRGKKFK